MRKAFALLKQTYKESQQDKVARLAASLAYFTIFSLAPLLMVAIAVAGAVFGREAATGEMVEQMRGLIGPEGSKVVEDLLKNAGKPKTGAFAAAIGIVTLVIGASGAFVALQDALNTVWGVMPKPGQGIRAIVKDRVLSFAMVVCIGFLLLVSLVVSAVLVGFDEWLNQMFPAADVLLGLLHQGLSFAVTTLLFALMFKYLPDVKIEWRDMWVGALVTALLFTAGKWLIGL